MEFKNKIITAAFILILAAQLIFSQESENYNYVISPYSIQLNLCLNNSLMELSGSGSISENIYNGKTFGAGKGFGAAVISKISFGRKSSFRFNQSVSYNRILSYDFDKTQYDIGEAYYNAFTLALGTEYNFSPARRYIFFIGAELNAGLINGHSKIWFERRGHPLGDSVAKYEFNSSIRMGYGLIFGAEYLINNQFSINTGIKFQNLNAFIKQSEGTNENAEFQIRDEDSPGLIFAGNKNFALMSYCLGLSLNFGSNSRNLK